MALVAMAFLWPFCLYWSWARGFGLSTTLRPLLPLLGLAAVELIFIFSITPEETNTGRAIGLSSEADSLGFIVGMGRLFLWALSRLLTTAHWLLVPLYEFHYWELYIGAGVLAGLLFLVYRRLFPGSLWSVWILLSLLPFLPITETGILVRPSGPSRYLYLATAGSSFLLACGVQEIINCLRPRAWGSKLLYAAIISSLFTSSYFCLKRVEALSFYSSGRNYISRGDTETGIRQLKRARPPKPGNNRSSRCLPAVVSE